MKKVILKIDGMACGMCEAHMNDVIRKNYPDAKKVKSSHRKGQTVFMTDADIDEDSLRAAIEETGYRLLSFSAE